MHPGGLGCVQLFANMYSLNRDKLREQNALSEEIVNAITGNTIGESIDEDELDAELEELQQEQLDEQMLKTGTVPVSDQIQRVPAVPAGDSKPRRASVANAVTILTQCHSQGQDTCCRGGRRRRGAAQVAGGNGHVIRLRAEAAVRYSQDSMTNDRTTRDFFSSPPLTRARRRAVEGGRLRFIQTETRVLSRRSTLTVGVGARRLDYYLRHKTDGISLQRGNLNHFQPCDGTPFISQAAHT